jgi:hypothetical protein
MFVNVFYNSFVFVFYVHNIHNNIEGMDVMSRRRKFKALTTFEKHPIGNPLVLLILIGVTIVDQYYIELNQAGNTLYSCKNPSIT